MQIFREPWPANGLRHQVGGIRRRRSLLGLKIGSTPERPMVTSIASLRPPQAARGRARCACAAYRQAADVEEQRPVAPRPLAQSVEDRYDLSGQDRGEPGRRVAEGHVQGRLSLGKRRPGLVALDEPQREAKLRPEHSPDGAALGGFGGGERPRKSGGDEQRFGAGDELPGTSPSAAKATSRAESTCTDRRSGSTLVRSRGAGGVAMSVGLGSECRACADARSSAGFDRRLGGGLGDERVGVAEDHPPFFLFEIRLERSAVGLASECSASVTVVRSFAAAVGQQRTIAAAGAAPWDVRISVLQDPGWRGRD